MVEAPNKTSQTDLTPLMIRVEEAAELCGLGRSKFLQLLYRGDVPGVVRFGRAVRINRPMLETWLNEQCVVATQPGE